MYKAKLLTVMITLILLACGSAYAEDWKVGEKWVYKHEGPRPFSDASNMVKGDRTAEVTAIKGEGANKRYLLKNVWGTEDANPTTSYIDPRNRLHKIEIQYMAVLLLAPPVPTVWPLKAGEQKTLKTKMDAGGFSVPIEYVGKRLKDETVTVPAGKFENCQHVQIIITMQNEMGQPVKGKTEYWYHPKVRNLVKEVTVTNYQGENSYTATSLLKSHTTKN